eukprot:g9359.t1
MTIVFTGSAYGAEMDMSQAPCKFLEEGPNFSNKKDYTYGTNGKICVIRDTTNSGAATNGNIDLPNEDHRSHCGNIGYTDTGTYKQYQIPLKSGGNIAIAISGGRIDTDMKDPFGQTAKTGERIEIFGGVAKRLYASVGTITDASRAGATGGGNDKCFSANEITTEDATFTWKAPKSGAGTATFQAIVGTNTNTKLTRDNTASTFMFVGQASSFSINEGFVAAPSELGANTDIGVIIGIIGAIVAGLLIIVLIVFYLKKKNQRADPENNGDGGDDKNTDIETEKNYKTTSTAAVVPVRMNKQNEKNRSWIQKVARRANEFGRQVPENIQVEAEVYDDFVDTFMTVVLWILLIGVLLFTIVDEYTNPANMSVAFCSENRASYCNTYYKYDELGNCGGEAKDAVGQADKSARTSMCGLRSDGDHLLSILTNYGALSGLMTALCRYIANTWKGCRRKKLERTTQI